MDNSLTLIKKLITKNHELRRFLLMKKRLEAHSKFAVGDYILEYHISFIDKKKRYTTSVDGTTVPAKFQVVYRDENGFTFAAKFKTNGNLGSIFCLDDQTAQYELDPEFVNHTLLGDNFDPKQSIDEARAYVKQVTQDRNNKGVWFHNESALTEWGKNNLKPGVTFWVAPRMGRIRATEFTMISSEMVSGTDPIYGWNCSKSLIPKVLQLTVQQLHDGHPLVTGPIKMDLIDLDLMYFLEQPMQYKKDE